MIKQGFADIQEGNFLYKNNFAKVKTLAEKNG
ncbi:hypothetical protein [Candidatus Kryptonium thompsonii]